MANSKRKELMNYLRDTTLAHMTVLNGYNYDVQTNKRGYLEMDNPPDSAFPAVFISSSQENRENITKVNTHCKLVVHIEGYVKNSTGTTGLQQNLDDLIEDITRALERDRTLGGHTSKWLEIKSIKTDESDDQAYGGVAITVELNYVGDQTLP